MRGIIAIAIGGFLSAYGFPVWVLLLVLILNYVCQTPTDPPA